MTRHDGESCWGRQSDLELSRRFPAYHSASMHAQPTPVIVPETDEEVDVDKPWQVVVWNDPVNTMSYVVYVFRKLFGYDDTKATKLMLEVHHDGRSIVSDGPRETAEIDCFRLHNHGLWATIER